MCEQTEINYLDGDIVWVKLGACWWPGQVTGFHNLPKDIQDEFQKKPLIAAVKFFQEDTYEFVKNYQQIYKYNCTQKDEFIRKGLDKYRSKSKDGSRYMDKFPGDVQKAEKLTGGDPEILNRDKFCPEEKPNISALFGDKKVTKKRKEREETSRRSDNTMEVARKITHPRFLRESDHEVRIRQQPSSLPSTPNNTGSPQYPCHLCNFTSSRVNVIICHIKSHRSGSSPMSKTKVSTYSQYRGRHSDVDTPKRKYVRKEKSQSSRSKSSGGESGKRKQIKQNEKAAKKKKMDPKIRDTILADWEDESDEDVNPNHSKQSDSINLSVNNSPTRSHFDLDKSEESDRKNNTLPDPNEIIAETDKLLKETEKLTSINIMEHSETDNINISKSFKSNLFDKQSDREKDRTVDVETNECADRSQKGKESSNSDNESKYSKNNTVKKDDRKSLLSCFDFHEEEPSIPPVRKKARAFHQKKEIIKEFEMSQALKTEQEKQAEKKTADEDNNIKSREIENEKMAELMSLGVKDLEKYGKCKKLVEEDDKPTKNEAAKVSEKLESEKMSADVQKSDTGDRNTESKPVEMFQDGKSEDESITVTTTSRETETQQVPKRNTELELSEDKELNVQSEATSVDKPTEYKSIDIDHENTGSTDIQQPSKEEIDEISSERFTTETEDETVSESADTLPDQSETEDADMPDQDQRTNLNLAKTLLRDDQLNVNVTPQARKRRGRPRKSDFLHGTGGNASGTESPRIKDNKTSQKLFEKFEIERRTSESDSERSYSGRKRKPNKKYLESDIYVQDLDQRIYKTDESQSENEEKSSEKVKGRTKRNKKLSTTDKKTSEKIEFEVEKELEISCSVSNLAGNNLNCSGIELQGNVTVTESSTRKDEVDTKVDTKDSDNQASNEIYEKNTIALDEKDSQKCASTFAEDTKSREVESVAETKDTLLEPEKVEDIAMETENLSSASDVRTENLKNLNIECSSAIQPEISTEKETSPPQTDILKTVEMLPPKKSQIKKFELSQIDFFDSGASVNKSTIEPELDSGEEKLKHVEAIKNDANADETHPLKGNEDVVSEKLDSDATSEDTTKEESKEERKPQRIEEALPSNDEVHRTEMETSDVQKQELKSDSSENVAKDAASEQQQPHNKSSMQTRYKGKFTPETGAKSKKDKELSVEEKSANTFQEAFLKTLHIDKKKGGADDSDTVSKGKKGKKSTKKKSEEDADAASTSVETVQDVKANEESTKKAETLPIVRSEENDSQVTVVSNFEGIEVVVDQNVEIDAKANDTVFEHVNQFASSSSASNEPDNTSKSLAKMRAPSTEDASKSINIDIQKIDESSRMSPFTPSTPSTPSSPSTPSPSSDVAVPVKKREMPRIIKNVTLTEPMQILKSKLLDKFPQKGTKHKLEAETPKRSDQKGGPKAKVMKIECLASNAKMKTGSKVTSHMSLTKKLQVLKAEEAETAAMMEAQNEQLNLKTSKACAATAASEKFIQQSSQSLADMELDINSMPFVLSEDVLTPENIEQMPVVISSIIPASSTIPATLSFTPTTQIVSHTQTQYKLSENTTEVSPTKKKSGTPAILKNKSKAKPTITSIKTIVPPLTGGVKGIKFQSAPATSKVPPLLTQKGTPSKYVVVQTSAGQQLRYSVQGKPSTQQKIAIPTGKTAGNTQVVQQGGKVVILTSAQSGQTKMLPLNIAKTLGNKVQRIMTSKGQVLCPISPQGIINSKTVIAPKGDGVAPATSKLPAGHKIINTQGIITSKGVLTPISGTIGKTALLGTLSQGILTKGGIYTPISASTLGGKTIIGSKTLVTKGATILSSQNLGTSKAILTPISQAISGKTILSPQGIASKATVLTPITGQQVKAIAAKSPSKPGKVQYQSVQQKVQLPMLQKSQKVTMSSSQGRSGQSKSAANTVVMQNTVSAQKTTGQGKRIIKQTVVQTQASPIKNITTQSGSQQTMSTSSQVQKGKAVPTSAVQKVIVPRGGRQSKTQQKILVQKVQEPTITAVQNIQAKQTVSGSLANVPSMSKIGQQKHPVTPTKSGIKGHHAVGKSPQQQKNLFNVTMNSAAAANVSANLSASLSLPPLEPIEPEKKMKKVETVLSETVQKESKGGDKYKFGIEKGGGGGGGCGEASEKLEDSKIPAQPQIMALPTESSDGTQTYVLVTIDEQGQIHPLDNNALMSLEGTTQNPDGTRTLYIDPSSLGEAGTLDNIVLQFDNGGALPNIQSSSSTEPAQTIVSESFPSSEVMQTSNQDILAAALANTDFQQEINLSENPAGNVMTAGLTQTSLINQTILQSTIIPPTEPISSPSVLETSLTLNQPIMTPLEVPSNRLPIQSETASVSTVATVVPSSLELPITITNPSISYISTGEAQIQIPGNSMPDIGEIMESSSAAEIARTDVPVTTQYLVLPNLESNIPAESRKERNDAASMPGVSYSVSVPNSIVIQTSQVQTTPSMPIIDDTYTENVQFGSTVAEQSITTEQTYVADVAVSAMLVSKPPASTECVQSQDIVVTSEMNVSQEVSASSQEPIVSTNEPSTLEEEQQNTEPPLQQVYTSQQVPIHSEEMILQPSIDKEESSSNAETNNDDGTMHVDVSEQPDESIRTSDMPVTDETALVTSESSLKISPVKRRTSFEATDSNEIDTAASQQSENVKKLKELTFDDKVDSPVAPEQAPTSNEVEVAEETAQILPAESLNRLDEQSVDVDVEVEVEVDVDVDADMDADADEAIESKSYAASSAKESERCQMDEPSSQGEPKQIVSRNLDMQFEETNSETSHETPSQSYEQFGVAATTDSTDLPSQSATKSENSREPSQSITYEPMETDEEAIVTEPPSQSFEHSKMNEASQSYETSAEESTNAPTQSFNELMQSQEERSTLDEGIDDQTFPTQSYDVGKAENISENLETDTEISQEGNMPSQSNDIGADGIGTSSVSTNNSGLNEDETASSSYVPETPENQERDPDQESAISTSSCEIPPCAELNIASSSAEHTIIHDNGVPEIPTSSYNLNPDITSTHVDSVPSSSYEEQNVSTSYEVPISMPGLEETPSQNFVTESTDHRNEPSSYYAHHQEVTASYYEPVGQETNSRLDEDPQEEVTPSYYEGNPQEASQSYFNPEEATPSYSSHNVSPSYYDHRPESEASQSYYSTDDIEKSEQSSSQNIEASQSFYQEQSDELKLRQQGEATPTYTERYPVDYTLENSPIERHDLVESSVPATRPTER